MYDIIQAVDKVTQDRRVIVTSGVGIQQQMVSRYFTFDIKTKVSETGILKLIGNVISYPGRISQYANDNILQNYLLHFSKKFNFSSLSFYSGYHLENEDLQYINSNSGESYFSGINYAIEKEKYE